MLWWASFPSGAPVCLHVHGERSDKLQATVKTQRYICLQICFTSQHILVANRGKKSVRNVFVCRFRIECNFELFCSCIEMCFFISVG